MTDLLLWKADRAAFRAEEWAGPARAAPPEFAAGAFARLARRFRAAAAAASRAGRAGKAGEFLARATLAASASRKAERVAPRLARALKLAA